MEPEAAEWIMLDYDSSEPALLDRRDLGRGDSMGLLASEAAAVASRGTILVVDDEVLIRFVMCEELRAAGYSVIEASSADEALVLLCAELPADLMISDVRMPGILDGVGLARSARVIRPEMAIALSSAHFTPAPGELAGVVDAFLPKPYLSSRLVDLADRLLEAHG